MGTYLNMQGNRKEDTRTGRVPDENYAREVMQLFTIGLLAKLNPDGTPQTSAGKPLESYTQTDITQLARVFTGWVNDRTQGVAIAADSAYVTRPMRNDGSQLPGGRQDGAGHRHRRGTCHAGLRRLAASAGHPVPATPTSAPSLAASSSSASRRATPAAAYVGRVAAVFNDNGSGVRGDLKAHCCALCCSTPKPAPPPRQPAAADCASPSSALCSGRAASAPPAPRGRWAIGDLSDPATRLGQSPMRSPSVFNFFRPGYVPPGNELAANQRDRAGVPAGATKARWPAT